MALDFPTAPFSSGPAGGSGGLAMPTAPFSSGPAVTPPAAPTPSPPTTTPPTTGQVDPREQLASLLAPVPGQPLLRRGKVTSLVTTGSVWAAYVATDGYNDRPRRMQWNGNGSKPAVGDAVYYYNASPVPLIIGRVPTPNQDQDFGTGTVTGGDFVDGQGSIRGDLSSTSSTVASLNSTVSSHTSTLSSHTSSITSLNNTVGSHTATLSTHTAQISSHTSQISSLTSLTTLHTAQIKVLNDRVFIDINAFLTELYNRMANVEARLTAGGH